jgi:hypothetical protein
MSKRDIPIGDLHKAEIAKLKRKVAELEKMLMPGQVSVYKAAMRWDKADLKWPAELKLSRACKKSRMK